MKSIELQIENELKGSEFITCRIEPELLDKLNTLSKERGATRSAFIRALIKFGVDAVSKTKQK
jgi:predicted DNA-binding protein